MSFGLGSTTGAGPLFAPLKYKIFNLLGVCVQKGTLTIDSSIYISDLATGSYFLQLGQSEKYFFLKE